MAVVADQYLIELESNISKVVSREDAALRNLDKTLGRTSAEVARLEAELGQAGAALQKATAGRGGIVNVAEVRLAQKEIARVQGALDKSKESQATLRAARPKFDEMAAVSKRSALEREAAKARKQADAEAMKASKEAAAALLGPAQAAQKATQIVGIAVAALAAGYMYLALSAASAARNQRILGEALTDSEAGGKEFSGIVNQLSRQIPLAKDKIREMARELSIAKLGGRDLQATLTAMGIVASAVGDQGAAAVKSIAEQSRAARRFIVGGRDIYGEFTGLAGTGLKKADLLGALSAQLKLSTREVERRLLAGRISVEQGVLALEAAAKTRFGKTIAAQMLDINVQFQKAKEAFDAMFGGVDLDPLLKGLKEILSVLDTSTVTGDALKFLLTRGMQSLVETLGGAAPLVKAFFQGMIIAALRMYIVLKPIYNDIRDLFGGKPGDGIETAAKAGERALYAMAIAAAFLGVAMFVALLPLIVLLSVIGGAIYAVVAAVKALIAVDFAKLGSDIVDGIAEGITGAAGRAMSAIRGLGSSLLRAFRESIDAHSPSRLFHEVGEVGIGGGVEGGVRAGSAGVHNAIEGLGEARPRFGEGASRGVGTHIESLTIGSVVMGNGKPAEADVDSMVRATFRRVLEEINESGMVPEPA